MVLMHRDNLDLETEVTFQIVKFSKDMRKSFLTWLPFCGIFFFPVLKLSYFQTLRYFLTMRISVTIYI